MEGNMQAKAVSLSGVIRYAAGGEVSFFGREVLSCFVNAGVQDGLLMGAVVSRRCTLVLHNEKEKFTLGFALPGARVQLFLHQGDVIRPLCVFFVDRVTRQDASTFLTLSGTDVPGFGLEDAWEDDLTYPLTLQQLADALLARAGLDPLDPFPGGEQQVAKRPEWGSVSLRQALSFIAGACGCFCQATPEGKVGLFPVWQAEETPLDIFPEETFRLVCGDETFGPLKGLTVHLKGVARQQVPLTVQADATPLDGKNSLTVSDNPLFAAGDGAAHSRALELLGRLKGMTFSRLQVQWQGDEQVRLGRRIRVWDTHSAYTDTLVTSLSVTVDTALSMQTDCTYQAPSGSAGRIFTPSGGINAAFLQGEMDGALLKDGSITAHHLAAQAVDAEKIAAGAVRAHHLSAGAVQTEHLSANSVSAGHLQAQAVQAGHLQAGAVTADKIAGAAISARHLQAGLITADSGLLADGCIGTAQIADGSITQAKVVSLNADVITSGTLKTDRLLLTGEEGLVYEINASSSGLTKSQLADEQYRQKLNGTVIVSHSITADQIAAQSISANEILTGTITAGQLAAGAVTADKLAAQSVTANHLTNDAGSGLDLSGNESVRLVVRDEKNKGLETASVSLNENGIQLHTGGTFLLESGNFSVDEAGNVQLKGTVEAEGGRLGGWEISPGALHSGTATRHVRLSTADAEYGLWAGAEYAENAPFRVARDGSVFLTRLYVTDENGVACEQPVNLRTSWWKMDRAYARSVQSLAVNGNTLVITLQDGTSVNFKKAASMVNIRQAWSGGRLVISTDTPDVLLSGILTVSVNSAPEGLSWGGEHNAVATFRVTSDRGVIVSGMQVDATHVYEDGYAQGWAAAKAAVKVDGSITGIRNVAANTFYATGSARASVEGETVASCSFHASQSIQVGQ